VSSTVVEEIGRGYLTVHVVTNMTGNSTRTPQLISAPMCKHSALTSIAQEQQCCNGLVLVGGGEGGGSLNCCHSGRGGVGQLKLTTTITTTTRGTRKLQYVVGRR
jgi:hypothetical protein